MREGAFFSACLVASVALASCGASTTTVTHGEAAAPGGTASSARPTQSERKPANPQFNNPAQRPDPSVKAYCNEVPLGHPCHAVTAAPEDPNVAPQRNCDTNIVANSRTSCGLAENAFYEYYQTHAVGSKSVSIMVHSPTTGQDYELGCGASEGLIGCVSSPTAQGIFVDFPEAAVRAYTAAQATAYAHTRDVGHPGTPFADKARRSQPESQHSEPESHPGPEAGGEDEVGSYSHATDEKFCQEHECIGDFEGEDGYVVECVDGSYSHAGGKSGACSSHGGENRRE